MIKHHGEDSFTTRKRGRPPLDPERQASMISSAPASVAQSTLARDTEDDIKKIVDEKNRNIESLEKSPISPKNTILVDKPAIPKSANNIECLSDENAVRLKSLQTAYNKLQREFQQKEEFCERLISKTHVCLKTFKNHNEERQEELDKLKAQLADKDREIERLETRIEAAQKEGDEMKKKYSKLEEDFKEKSTEQAEEITLLNQSKDELRKDIQKLRHGIQDYRVKQKVLEKDSREKDEKVSELEVKLQRLEKESKEKVNILQETLVKRGGQIRDLEEQEDSLQHRLRLSEKKLMENKVLLSESTEENLLLRVNLDKTREELQQSISSRNNLILETKSELENAQNLIIKSENKLSDQADVISDNNTEILNLRSSLSKKEEINSIKNKEISNLMHNLEKKTQELEKKEKEIDGLYRKLYESVKETHVLKEKLNLKDSLISDKEQDIRTLNSKFVAQNNKFERELGKRYELLVQQQELNRSLISEIDSVRLSSENHLRDLQDKTKLAAEEKLELVEKLDDKRRLLRKMKKFLLYQMAEDQGSDKGSETGDATPTVTPTETLQTSQSMRGCKRKSESELTPLSPSQRLRTVGTTHIVADLLHDLIVHDVFADLL